MNQLVVTIIIILLPGITATVVCDQLIVHSKWDSFKFGLYSLVLGVLTYALLQLFFYVGDIFRDSTIVGASWSQLKIWRSVASEKPEIPGTEVVLAVVLSAPVAFFISWLVKYKLINKFAQRIGVSLKFGDENLYSYYLNAEEIDWIYVRDPIANLTYQGKVQLFSENDAIQELVLSEVTVFRYEDSEELYSVPTIYLAKETGKFIIEAIPNALLGDRNDKQVAN